ncbi:hypothetical protein [Rhodohalobacter sp. 614A]|uniref:hypothetical protein n=1 Tax=Rhodohalobacter sp. 614A TaxID=2908649 RepID=UPI001F1C106C|nr:hypothetical protein [Rhodohalobacter sp. 614A]
MKFPEMRKITLSTALLFVFCSVNLLYAQDWDYQKYPKLDITLQHLNADIHIDEFGAIEGDVLYRASVNVDDPDSLVFDASRLNILGVWVNDAEKQFSAQNDQLAIYLDEVFAQQSVLNIRIQYEANPKYGVLRDVNRITWTSQLPKSTRHWLPVIDHPRAQFTTEFVFTHPSGNTMIANGRRMESGVVSVDEERSTFQTSSEIPATALGWALGEFYESGSENVNRLRRDGNQSPIQVHVYSETEVDTDANLATVATNALQTVRNSLRTPYPFRDLNIVILDNDFWETKTYAAGILFVYRDRGDIENQIRRGVLSQWIGTYIREEQWNDADAIQAIHARLSNQLFDLEPETNDGFEPYDVFSPYSFSKWENFMNSNDLPRFKASLDSSLNTIFNDGHNILGWNELSEIIYNRSGQPFFEGFEFEDPESEESQPIVYTAGMDWNETDNTIQINFEAVNQSVDELVTVSVEEITFQGPRQHEVTFTGESESSVLSVSSGIENMLLSIEGRDDIELNVEKPFMFWIYQLRNSSDPQERQEAAKGLAAFTDNPDLQLALDDILRVESNPEVYAEIVRALSKLTAGASGMDQRFLDYSSNQQHPAVRTAAVQALAEFPNNERVISRLQTVILQSENAELQQAAIRSMAEVTDAERFNTIAGNLVSREPVLEHVPLILQLLAEKGEEESAVEMASTFITEQFPYEVRNEALEIVLEYDRSSRNWEERLSELFADTHPGIRYRAASALQYVNGSARNSLVEQVLQEEYDERVRILLESYQSN